MLVKEIDLSDGGKFQIHTDECPESPRDWDNLGAMVCFHKRYILGDDNHDYCQGDFNSWDDLKAQIEEDHDVVDILPIYMYDHSGVTISTTPFSCPWDSGQIGFIFATVQQAKEVWDMEVVVERDAESIRRILLAEVEAYDQYLRGEVYSFVLEDADGEVQDSCGGFFGDPVESGMIEHLSVERREEIEAAL